MIVEKIKIANFKKITSVEIPLHDITYIIGGNSSGKSSILQAIHMAVGCAQASIELQQQVISESSLRYCPTGDFQRLGRTAPYENKTDGSRGVVEFVGKTGENIDAAYRIEIYKARNHNNVGVNRAGVYNAFGQYICDSNSLFSVYVPGLAGVPHREELQSYSAVFRKAAGGEANLVFRNIIRIISEQNKLGELEERLHSIIGPCKFQVTFDEKRDLYVDVKISFEDPYGGNSFMPIDLSGTGILQITQILAYVILFQPKILLVDEPDSHLHPSRQNLLSKLFSDIASIYNCRILVCTHSRHLISSASSDAQLIWMKNGEVGSVGERDLAAILLDLGALDQIDSSGAEYIICTEDSGKEILNAAVEALGLSSILKIISYNGVSNKASAAIIAEMASLFSRTPKIFVHRDRDFLTDQEISKWSIEFVNRGLAVFCPKLCDVESYVCEVGHLSRVYEVDEQRISSEINEIISRNLNKFRGKFTSKREDANRIFWRAGGSPTNESLWPADSPPPNEMVYGKELLSRINEDFPKLFGGRKNIYNKAPELLRDELRQFLSANGVI